MTKEQRAFVYAKLIKAGKITINDAIPWLRQAYLADFIEGMELMQIAIGNLNEFGPSYDPLTDRDSVATL